MFEITNCDLKNRNNPTMLISKNPPVPLVEIDRSIYLVRGERVLLDKDLAYLYGIETRILNQAVRRNLERFPEDFMVQLTENETGVILRSQIVDTTSADADGRGGRRYRAYAFTEQGVAMLSSVLNSPRAIAVNIEIMRAFVRLRQLIASHADLARKLDALEQKYEHHDHQFKIVFDAIRELMTPPTPEEKRREIGFGAHMKPPAAANPKSQ